ncbi:MAG: DUF4268 domain-containing protein [Armatimonadetes bacterium]|nr:DUF4268 domain-containing protein [Armatimonadota bacterium]
MAEAIAKAQRYFSELPAPPNEANTCSWVIHPLLLAAGYEHHEIHGEVGGASGKIPDFTLLPKTNWTWFVEAKAWDVKLDNWHVDQALFYAHANGKRWVVLTNGKEWRLFDDSIAGMSEDRLVASSYLQNTDEMAAFLGAVSKSSMLEQRIEVYATSKRVRKALLKALSEPSSGVIASIVKTLSKELNAPNITAQMVVNSIPSSSMKTTDDACPKTGVEDKASESLTKDDPMQPSQYLKYWADFRTFLLQKDCPVKPGKAGDQSWLDFSQYGNGVGLVAVGGWRDSYLSIQLYIRDDPNKIKFDYFLEHRGSIDAAITGLIWDRKAGCKASSIDLRLSGTDLKNESQRAAQHQWMFDSIVRFHTVFSPLVKKLV